MSTSELETRINALSMRKSVENLMISSQDAIGHSINQALNFSGVITQHADQIGHDCRSTSRSRSPSPSLRIADGVDSDTDKLNEIALQAGLQVAEPGSVSVSASSDSSVPYRLDKSDSNKATNSIVKGADASAVRTKKKSWYNALYPTYKSKSEDFKRIFKDLPEDERLIVDYSCALQKDILAHGRLYASQRHLCFHANIFGWETSLTLRWTDVTAITKEKTALVIPNAIVVCTDNERHFLASFSGRDKAYLMLFRVWQHALMDQPVTTQEIWQWIHTCYGEELGFTSDDDAYRDRIDEPRPEDVLDTSSADTAARDPSPSPSPTVGGEIAPPAHLNGGGGGDAVGGGGGGGDVLPTDMSDSSDSEPDKHNADSIKCTNDHEGRVLLERQFPFKVDQLFTMIFTNTKFSVELLAARRIRDYVQAAWESQAGVECRRFTYTQQISAGPLGPSEVHVTETQVMNKCSVAGSMYSIDATSENAGIPYADYFSVRVHYCLRAHAPHHTHVRLIASLHYKKPMWKFAKGFVEKNTYEGLEQFAQLLESRLVAEAEAAAPAKRPGRRRRRVATGVVDGAVATPGPIRTRGEVRAGGVATGGAWLVGVLVVLVLLNALLCWRLQHADRPHHDQLHDLHDRMSSLSGEQLAAWSRVLEQHSQQQRHQLRVWHRALAQAVAHLSQTEKALAQLIETIKPTLERAEQTIGETRTDL